MRPACLRPAHRLPSAPKPEAPELDSTGWCSLWHIGQHSLEFQGPGRVSWTKSRLRGGRREGRGRNRGETKQGALEGQTDLALQRHPPLHIEELLLLPPGSLLLQGKGRRGALGPSSPGPGPQAPGPRGRKDGPTLSVEPSLPGQGHLEVLYSTLAPPPGRPAEPVWP